MTEEQMKDVLNHMARTDPEGFRNKLGTRFKVNHAQLDTIYGQVQSPADAFMIATQRDQINL